MKCRELWAWTSASHSNVTGLFSSSYLQGSHKTETVSSKNGRTKCSALCHDLKWIKVWPLELVNICIIILWLYISCNSAIYNNRFPAAISLIFALAILRDSRASLKFSNSHLKRRFGFASLLTVNATKTAYSPSHFWKPVPVLALRSTVGKSRAALVMLGAACTVLVQGVNTWGVSLGLPDLRIWLISHVGESWLDGLLLSVIPVHQRTWDSSKQEEALPKKLMTPFSGCTGYEGRS